MALDAKGAEKILKDALSAVEGASIPDALRDVAFEKAVDLLSGAASGTAASGAPQVDGSGTAGPSGSGDDSVARIAKKTGADEAAIGRVYDLDADDVAFIVRRNRFADDRATATKEVTLLYCAARQAGGYDEGNTGIKLVKERVESMGVLDPKNFAKHTKSIDGVTVKGTGSTREFKVTQPGYDAAGTLIAQLASGGQS